MTPNQEGRYLGVPLEWTVEPVGNEQSVAFTVNCILTHLLDPKTNEWIDVADRGMTIIGNAYLVKKDGTLNPHGIKSVKESFGWNGASFTELANADWSNTQVQLTLALETYSKDGQSRTSMKVKWFNHKDYAGGSISRDPQAIQNLEDKYGSMLRAEAGPAKPAQRPAAPANGNGNAPANPLDAAKKEAWAKWLRTNPEMAKDERASKYRETAIDYFGTENFSGINAIQWKAFAENDFKKPVSPIVEGEEHFTQDDIPF